MPRMHRLDVAIVACVCALLVATADASAMLRAASATPTPPARVVPVTEDTAAPGTSSSVYTPCYLMDNSKFANEILAESNECAIKTSYEWTGTLLPTAAERRELCSCTQLIDKLQEVVVPRCSLVRSGSTISYATLIAYAFGLCSVDGGTTPPTTTSTKTTTPSTTSSDSISSNNNNNNANTSDDEDKPKKSNHAAMFAGVIGGIVVLTIVAFAFVCSRKRSQNASSKSETAAVQEQTNDDAHGGLEAMPLSPLGDDAATGFAVVPKTPPTDPRHSAQSNHKSTGSSAHKSNSTQRTTMSVGTYGTRVAGSDVGVWDDPLITAVRIPYDGIFFGALLSRGGYGEVYKGTYKGETVAIKQLLPDRRKDLVQIDAFMSEVKLMSTLDHERIVKFIGVAWNSLSDACVVVEYMANGDLRAALTRWEHEEHRPRGFDADKAKIALHVAHALTYLHSCQPIIVHRDLKSKNILLSEDYDAKLTDFGVSRERGDSTMTAGVGTSLWMAPEVMMGQRYDEKADVFSFGVVLAELDSHELPYSHALDAVTGRRVADSAILQMVSLGRLTIEFSGNAHPDIAQLGRECVALDPKDRPTTGQVLHRVHQVFRQLS